MCYRLFPAHHQLALPACSPRPQVGGARRRAGRAHPDAGPCHSGSRLPAWPPKANRRLLSAPPRLSNPVWPLPSSHLCFLPFLLSQSKKSRAHQSLPEHGHGSGSFAAHRASWEGQITQSAPDGEPPASVPAPGKFKALPLTLLPFLLAGAPLQHLPGRNCTSCPPSQFRDQVIHVREKTQQRKIHHPPTKGKSQASSPTLCSLPLQKMNTKEIQNLGKLSQEEITCYLLCPIHVLHAFPRNKSCLHTSCQVRVTVRIASH